MAAADRNYSEVEINPESRSYDEQSTIRAEGNYSYFIPQETPETFFVGYPRAREDTSEQQRRNGAANDCEISVTN